MTEKDSSFYSKTIENKGNSSENPTNTTSPFHVREFKFFDLPVNPTPHEVGPNTQGELPIQTEAPTNTSPLHVSELKIFDLPVNPTPKEVGENK